MDRFKSTKIASVLGIFGNLFLLIIKGIVASLSGSQAMVADAFNSAGDIFSSLMTYVGNRISCKKQTMIIILVMVKQSIYIQC